MSTTNTNNNSFDALINTLLIMGIVLIIGIASLSSINNLKQKKPKKNITSAIAVYYDSRVIQSKYTYNKFKWYFLNPSDSIRYNIESDFCPPNNVLGSKYKINFDSKLPEEKFYINYFSPVFLDTEKTAITTATIIHNSKVLFGEKIINYEFVTSKVHYLGYAFFKTPLENEQNFNMLKVGDTLKVRFLIDNPNRSILQLKEIF